MVRPLWRVTLRACALLQARALPPQMLKQMGGAGGLQQLMRQLEGKDLSSMMSSMGMG